MVKGYKPLISPRKNQTKEWTKSDAMIALRPLKDEVLMPYSEN